MAVGALTIKIISDLELSGRIQKNPSGRIVFSFVDEYDLELFLAPIIERAITEHKNTETPKGE